MKLRIKRTHPEAKIPQYAHPTDACVDLTCVSIEKVNTKSYGYLQYDTGLQIEISPGYIGLIFPRSSISNTGLILSNAVGVIDEAYRGNIKARFKAIPATDIYGIGERCCQFMVIPKVPLEFEEFTGDWEETERNDSGWGSSGK